jgi:hypothetical protein
VTARVSQLAVQLAAAIAEEDFASDCEVTAVRVPKFRLKDAVQRTQIKVFAAGQAFDGGYRDSHVVEDTICQIGVFKLVTVTDGEPDETEVDGLLEMVEALSLFALESLAEVPGATPITVENSPLFDLEMLAEGRFLSVINVTHRMEVE